MMYLITGGSGSIGRVLARQLAHSGAQVRVFDVRAPARQEAGVEFVQGDVRDVRRLTAAMSGADAVCHLAQVVGRERMPAEIVHGVNAGGTANAVVAAREAGVPRFVLRSSADVYGDAAAGAREDATSLRPTDQFAVAKLEGEAHCARAHREAGLETVALRLSWVVGTRETDTWLRPMLWALRHRRPIVTGGDGRRRVHLTAMSDCAAAFARAATVPGIGGEVFNVAGVDAPALADLIEQLRIHLGSSSPVWRVPEASAARVLRGLARLRLVPLLPEQVQLLYADRVLDTTKARARLGWSAQLSAVEAVLETIAPTGARE